MPRTIYSQRPDSNIDARESATISHWTSELRRFRQPCKVRPSQSTAVDAADHACTRLLWTPPGETTHIEKALGEATPEDLRHFCFKDCAIYLTGTRSSCGRGTLQLYEKIYRRWYPTRADDTDISHGSFFCMLMAYENGWDVPPASIREILDFHKVLCSKLDQEVPKLPNDPPRRHALYTAESHLHLPPAQYRLRSTFSQCVIILHMESREHSIEGPPLTERGVITVWQTEEDAKQHGCVPSPEKDITKVEVEGLGTAQAFRCSLDEAMRLVVSTDPERRTMKREWHGYYQEWLGESEDVSVELCQCSSCQPHLYPCFIKGSGK